MASARTWESDASRLVREGTPVWEGNREPQTNEKLDVDSLDTSKMDNF